MNATQEKINTTATLPELIDSDAVDRLLCQLSSKELLQIISSADDLLVNDPLNAIETEEGLRWDKGAIEAAIKRIKARYKARHAVGATRSRFIGPN